MSVSSSINGWDPSVPSSVSMASSSNSASSSECSVSFRFSARGENWLLLAVGLVLSSPVVSCGGDRT